MDFGRIRSMIADAEARVRQHVGNLVQWTIVQRSTAKGEEDGAAGWPTDEAPASTRRTRRMQHYGFRSVPPGNTRAVMVLVGGAGAQAVTVAEDDQNLGPTSLAAGDAALYSRATGCVIKMASDGTITITATTNKNITVQASGSGQVNVTAAAVTGKVGLGPVANLSVLVQGTMDSMGVPVTQAPAATLTIVKAG